MSKDLMLLLAVAIAFVSLLAYAASPQSMAPWQSPQSIVVPLGP
jgi:hypothetical protein